MPRTNPEQSSSYSYGRQNNQEECPEPLPATYRLQLITNGDRRRSTAKLQRGGCVRVGIGWSCTRGGQSRPSGEHVVGPLPVDARRLRRRPEDDVEGVHDAGDVAQHRQKEGDEEL